MTRIAPPWIGFALALACAGCGRGPGAPPSEVEGVVPEASVEPEATPVRAVARVEPRSGSTLSGTATFTTVDGAVTLTLEVEAAPAGELAAHLHEVGDCSADDASSAGSHWNPEGLEHGRWGVQPFHLGDIGNLVVGQDGYGSLTLSTDLWSIGTGDPQDVVGRAVVVHEKADDFTTQPTGAAGGRIGCGVIEQR